MNTTVCTSIHQPKAHHSCPPGLSQQDGHVSNLLSVPLHDAGRRSVRTCYLPQLRHVSNSDVLAELPEVAWLLPLNSHRGQKPMPGHLFAPIASSWDRQQFTQMNESCMCCAPFCTNGAIIGTSDAPLLPAWNITRPHAAGVHPCIMCGPMSGHCFATPIIARTIQIPHMLNAHHVWGAAAVVRREPRMRYTHALNILTYPCMSPHKVLC
jgi:hypothetical protein